MASFVPITAMRSARPRLLPISVTWRSLRAWCHRLLAQHREWACRARFPASDGVSHLAPSSLHDRASTPKRADGVFTMPGGSPAGPICDGTICVTPASFWQRRPVPLSPSSWRVVATPPLVLPCATNTPLPAATPSSPPNTPNSPPDSNCSRSPHIRQSGARDPQRRHDGSSARKLKATTVGISKHSRN